MFCIILCFYLWIYGTLNKISNSKLQPTRCNVSWFIYFYRRPTCFRRFLRPSSGAHNCTCSFRYCRPILLLAATVEEMERSSISSTVAASIGRQQINQETLHLVGCNLELYYDART